jgi:hypothetical protein
MCPDVAISITKTSGEASEEEATDEEMEESNG